MNKTTDHEIPLNALQLAEEFVLAALARELDGTKLQDGDEIKIDRMNDCDCVPIYVDYEAALQPSGRWYLSGVQNRHPWQRGVSILSATYRFKATQASP